MACPADCALCQRRHRGDNTESVRGNGEKKGYIGELVFNMLVLVGAVKMADRVVREMMGL